VRVFLLATVLTPRRSVSSPTPTGADGRAHVGAAALPHLQRYKIWTLRLHQVVRQWRRLQQLQQHRLHAVPLLRRRRDRDPDQGLDPLAQPL